MMKGLKFRFPLVCRQSIVYTLPNDWENQTSDAGEVESCWATREVIERLFAQDAKLKRRFLGFFRRDCWGLFHVLDDQWVGYAWMTKAGRPGPVHMPNASEHNSCWIFHCGTKPAFRRQGLYKRSLRLLAVQSRQDDLGGKLYIDTDIDNLPSRRAIVSVGFQPYGLVRSWTWTVPKLKSWTFAKWQEDQQLPGMECRAA